MVHTIEEKGRQKERERSIKELSMEGFPPTMLDVVFLKELQIIRKASDRQGLFELARLKESPAQCLKITVTELTQGRHFFG